MAWFIWATIWGITIFLASFGAWMVGNGSREGLYGFRSSLRAEVNSRPNIVYILADDVGVNDIGYSSTDLKGVTETIDHLAEQGIVLENSYSLPLCTPARSALLTGKYPIETGTQYELIFLTAPWGLRLSEKLMPEYLRELGYINHMVGKWHLGFYKTEYTPIHRGFDTFYGYYSDAETYLSKKTFQSAFGKHYYDFQIQHRVTNETGDIEVVHDSVEGEIGPNGTFSSIAYAERVKSIIANHDVSQPLFLYLAAQNVHFPVVAPEYHKAYGRPLVREVLSRLKSASRREFAKNLALLDDFVSTVVDSLKDKGIWENTILVFSSDNGACPNAGGSNLPFRGMKNTLFEGGTRVPSFITSPLLGKGIGRRYTGLFHIVDWLPTLLHAAGGEAVSVEGINGINHWDTFRSGRLDIHPRKEFVYNIVTYPNITEKVTRSLNISELTSAIRVGDWKLILNEDCAGYISSDGKLFYESTPVCPSYHISRCSMLRKIDYFPKHDFLFNLKEDPHESKNLIDSVPDVASALKEKLEMALKIATNSDYVDLSTEIDDFSEWHETSLVLPWK